MHHKGRSRQFGVQTVRDKFVMCSVYVRVGIYVVGKEGASEDEVGAYVRTCVGSKGCDLCVRVRSHERGGRGFMFRFDI